MPIFNKKTKKIKPFNLFFISPPLSSFLSLVFTVSIFVLPQNQAVAATLSRIHCFNTDDQPQGKLLIDQDGNLYGTTELGGTNGTGSVYKLTPPPNGTDPWGFTTIYSFGVSWVNGAHPMAGLTMDSAGNLIGTTKDGGTNYASSGYNYGTVFTLEAGTWTHTKLIDFSELSPSYPARNPYSGVILDSAGNLFGTTHSSSGGYGTVFMLQPTSSAPWDFTLLKELSVSEGYGPDATLAIDKNGNLFGTARQGGDDNLGTVFMLSPPYDPSSFSVLASFDGYTGSNPLSEPVIDARGNVFGTTYWGGSQYGSYPNSYGTVFEVSPPRKNSTNPWTLSTLFDFYNDDINPPVELPGAGLVLSSPRRGDLFGTTEYGGSTASGKVFKLHPPKRRSYPWTYTPLVDFDATDSNNALKYPQAALVSDSAGNLYGTTSGKTTAGGTCYAAVFKVTP